MSYRWPLSVDTFTLLDKARIAWWILTTKQFTMGPKVAAFEKAMSEYSGMHALAVSSGSTANQLVFETWKIKHPGVTPVVIVPAVTWISSISPAMMAGMEVVPCDINLTDLSFDYDMLANLLERHVSRHVIIWPTALIGFCPDMSRMAALAARHGNAQLYLDSCENTFSRSVDTSILATADITTTSCYFAHEIVAIEMGFVFFRHPGEYDIGRMFRNHGMTRSLAPDHSLRRLIEADNPYIDPQFLFGIAGTNLRPTDVHAVFGLADMKRAEQSQVHRVELYQRYATLLDTDRYYLPPHQDTHVPFCLPIFVRDADKVGDLKAALREAGIEIRPMVGGYLGLQPCLRQLFDSPMYYPNAIWVHEHGMYVGLHQDVTPYMIDELVDILHEA